MYHREKILGKIIDSGVIAVIRLADTGKLVKVVETIQEGGVNCLEITMTVPDAIGMSKEVSENVSEDFLIGTGTILDAEDTFCTSLLFKVNLRFFAQVVSHPKYFSGDPPHCPSDFLNF